MSDVRISTELVETLAAIARWYPGTADPPRTTVSQTQIAYGSKPPLQSDVLSLRRQTLDTLASWVMVVAEERDLHTGLKADDVEAITSWLSAHAEWIAGHDGAHAATELGSLAQQLEQVVRQTRPAKVKLGPCPETDCAGTLTATVRRGDDYLPSAVRCDIAPRDHVWEPHDWPALGRRVPLAPVDVAPLRPAAGDAPLPREYGAGGIVPSPDVQVGVPGRRWRRRDTA